MTTMERIQIHLDSIPAMQPFSLKDVMEFGSRAAVDQALSRMARQNKLMRVARGIYMRTSGNPYVGAVPPDPALVAKAVAARTGDTIQVHGVEAARRMGLSTQVPSWPVFYTSGPSRDVSLGKLKISLRHVARRKLAMSDRPAGIALTALWYLGKEVVDVETVKQLRARLVKEEFEALCAAKHLMPGWMRDVFEQFERKRQDA